MNKDYDEKLLNPVLKSYYDAGLNNPDNAFCPKWIPCKRNSLYRV